MTSVSLSIGSHLGLGHMSRAPPASAAELTVTDPARDNAGPGLDIVSAVLQNTDYTVSGTVSFRADRDGTLIVGLKARDRGAGPRGEPASSGGGGRNVLLDDDGRIACDGLVVNWNNRRRRQRSASRRPACGRATTAQSVRGSSPRASTQARDVDFATTTEFVPRG